MLLVFLFLLGACFGSFLNVLIDRIPEKKTIILGRSHCDSCYHELSWFELIPIFSYIILQGKCRHCRKTIPVRNLIVEIFSAFLAIFFYQNILLFFIFSLFLVIFFIDLKKKIIPDKILFWLFLFILVYQLLNAYNLQTIFLAFVSGLGAAAFFYFLYLITARRGMGFGDVKFSFILGFFLSFPKILIGLYLAFLTGAILGVILILTGRKKLKDELPFGPFLILGTLISFFWGEKLITWWLKIV